MKLKRTDFPTIPGHRFWSVKPNPKSEAKPIKVELRQYIDPFNPKTKFSTVVGSISTTAQRAQLLKDAQLLIDRVADIDDVLGEY